MDEIWNGYIPEIFTNTFLYQKRERSVIKSLLKFHILTGCEVTSKVGTKSAAKKASHEMNLWNFSSFQSEEYGFKDTGLYLVKVLHGNLTCSTFDELQ